jgi:hypothetical protein
MALFLQINYNKNMEKNSTNIKMSSVIVTPSASYPLANDSLAEEYAQYVNTNKEDGYSFAVVRYSAAFAQAAEQLISQGVAFSDAVKLVEFEVDDEGITGFMYGCAMKELSRFWKHGDELRKLHNARYGVSEDSTGVVNPAILTISV